MEKASRSYPGKIYGASDGGLTPDCGYLPPPAPPFAMDIRARIVLNNNGTTSQVTVNDCIFNRNTLSDYHFEYDIVFTPSNISPIITLSNNVFSRQGLILVPVGSGTSVITALYNGYSFSKEIITVTFSGVSMDTFISWTPDSLGMHLKTQVEDRLLGADKNIYTSQNFTTHTYVRNPNCWLNQFSNVTALSPWNSVGGKNMGGTLISPRDALISSHYGIIGAGKTMKFIKEDNTVVTMTVAACTPGPTTLYPDFRVVTFTQDVPSGISFCKCLPTNWSDYLTYISGIPLWETDQEEKALIVHWYTENTRSSASIPTDDCTYFYEDWISGDSGSPRGLCINNELVLLTVATTGGAGGGSSLNYYRDWINAQMTQNGSPYQLTPIDLSEFPTYE